MIFSYQIRYN